MPLPFSRRASQTAPSFSRDFAGLKTLDHGVGPAINFTRASNATFFDASGTLQTAANDAPRFDHDPATAGNPSRGLLIEESRTNSIRNSQAGGVSAGTLPTNWVASPSANGLTQTIVGGGTEDGLAYLDIQYAGTPTASSSIFVGADSASQVVAADGQTWTFSSYVKLQAGALTNVTTRVVVSGRLSGGNIVSGQASNTTVTPTVSAIKTQRASVTRTMSDATVVRVHGQIEIAYTNGNPIDLTLRIAAPQLEQGAFATSYIPTTTAAATRSADSAVVTPISSFYNQAEGTLFAEYSRSIVSAYAMVYAFNNGSGNEEVTIESGVADPTVHRMRVTDGGTNQALLAFNSNVANTVYKLAGAYKVDDFASSQNGVTAVTDSSGTLPTPDRLVFASGSPISTRHIRKVAYYPRRLSNTLLQQLTT
jgi:hypothetical protein